MVNVTYDACKSLFQGYLRYRETLLVLNLRAQSLVWTDAAGNTGVYSPGNIAWVLASTALVWIMIPGIGFFYSGLLRCVVIHSSKQTCLTSQRQAEECSVYDIPEYDDNGCRVFPSAFIALNQTNFSSFKLTLPYQVVLLGFLTYIQ